ncbi:MAG: 3-dehydroquinate synthase [Gemmatimonadetes bacterium]|nr:3-dehydroquinate synthase [Gemmatimonadota bacterium]
MTRSTVGVRLGERSYEIHLGEGILAELPRLVSEFCPAASYAVISDSTVGPRYAERLTQALSAAAPCRLLTFPAGEGHKTRETWSNLIDQLLEAELGRDGAIVAVGGGVVGDVAGFVAATYLRGIRYVQVPTTLLAMIDSSIGGKTGIDTEIGKNLVGAFHQPTLVVADVATLASLPIKQLAAGVAEAVKHGAIADADYVTSISANAREILARNPAAMADLVRRSVEIKAGVVAADEHEQGQRAVLNFGHTVGHAVEAASGYELLHGEAVALGMVVEAALGSTLGITKAGTAGALESVLQQFDLPTQLPEAWSAERILQAMRHDKKNRAGSIRVTLLHSLGEVANSGAGEWTHAVDEAAVHHALSPGF